jgi:tubulin polyglutamylase TTLL4
VRFATEDYKKGDYDNIFIHLTNYSINKLNAKYKKNTNTNNNNNIQCCEDEYDNNNNNNSEIDDNSNCINNDENEDDGDPSSKWSLHEYKAYFIQHNKKEQFDNIWRGIKDIVIKTAITVKDNSMREIPLNKSHTLFELFGFDIIIDKKYRPWLIEVNTNPSLNCSSPLDLNIKTDLITDIINVIGVKPIHHQIQNVSYSLDGSYKTLLEICRAGGEVERDSKGKDHGVVRMEIMKRFNGDFKWKEMYNKECYKKMIEYNEEEEERMKVTGFERVFPSKDSVKKYMRFISGNEGLSDWDIVFWSYVVNKSKGEERKEKEEVGEVVNVRKDNNVSEDNDDDNEDEEGDEDNDNDNESIDKYNDNGEGEGGQKKKEEKEMEMEMVE